MKRIEKLIIFFAVVGTVAIVRSFFGTDAALAVTVGFIALHLAEHETTVRIAYLSGRADAFDKASEIVKDEIAKVRSA